MAVLPSTVRNVAVLDRTKEPGAPGEPLYLDVVVAMAESGRASQPKVVGGRYGLSSKEFTPAMVKGILDELGKDAPKNHFTVGINDDLSHTSLDYDPAFAIPDETMREALFFGLGADGTVGANKNSIKIIGESTDLHAQGYFVYDSKKSGASTVSHLRFGKRPIRRPYLIREADFLACHKFNFVEKMEMLPSLRNGGVFLLNAPYSTGEIWDQLPMAIQEQILQKELKFYIIDASKVARDTGMGQRINTIMQTCFFALSGVLPREEAIEKIKKAIEKTYFKKGPAVIQQNFKAVDETLSHLYAVIPPDKATNTRGMAEPVPAEAPVFVQEVTAAMMRGHGDDLPVSAFPADGTFPPDTRTTNPGRSRLADPRP